MSSALWLLGPMPPWWRPLARRSWRRARERSKRISVSPREFWQFVRFTGARVNVDGDREFVSLLTSDGLCFVESKDMAEQPNASLARLKRSNERRVEYLVQPIRYGGTYRVGGHNAGCAQFRAQGGDCDCPPETT